MDFVANHQPTTPSNKSFYRALCARDRRFDGVFFVGVTSTRIYCRPICPARTPKLANCRFYCGAALAEQAGFRPCLRCRPELAPGNAPVDRAQNVAQAIVLLIEDGNVADDGGLEAVADRFELSSRHIRRIIQQQLGVPPSRLVLTRRLLLAKRLLTETALPITEIAFASGFASLRRFNDAFKTCYQMAPSRLRHSAMATSQRAAAASCDPSNRLDASTLQLAYRPPFDWRAMIEFLMARRLEGVEWITQSHYARTAQLGRHRGWIRVTPAYQAHALQLQFSHSLVPALPMLLSRVRNLFDLDARPDLIKRHLQRDPYLERSVRSEPGLRVPGAFDGFEIGVRAILGQQVTVRSATAAAAKVAQAFGESISTPFAELHRLAPTAARIARARDSEIAQLGISRAQARTMVALAQANVEGLVCLDPPMHQEPEMEIERLALVPGIGAWTAHYIAMRALRWPDAFPPGDAAVRARLGGLSQMQIEKLAQRWKPWRSYALLHLWRCRRETLPVN